MRVKILLQITTDDGASGLVEEIASLAKSVERVEDLGLSLAESKILLAAAQLRIVEAQTKSWTEARQCCEFCNRRRRSKGSYPILFHTLFGDVRLASPRLHRCPCREGNGTASVSPLTELIPHHVAPERLYLETRWASLVPYAAAAELLADVLPIETGVNATTLRQHVLRVAERAEAELPKDKCSFTKGSPLDWEALPIPDGRIVVGLDGGYVRDWTERKSNFEVIVGRSMPEDGPSRYLGFVHGFDRKPKRRLFDVLESQGMQANQDITFLTDGGEEVRSLTERICPCSEHVLDWFHITMRITVLGQFAKGVAQYDEEAGARLTKELERIKWKLWHGNTTGAQEVIEDFEIDLFGLESGYPNLRKFLTAAREFAAYIASNTASLINYGERYRSGERISSAFVEATVNAVVSKRFAKKAADAMDPTRRASSFADPHQNARRNAAINLRALVSGTGQRHDGPRHSGRGRMTAPDFVMVSYIRPEIFMARSLRNSKSLPSYSAAAILRPIGRSSLCSSSPVASQSLSSLPKLVLLASAQPPSLASPPPRPKSPWAHTALGGASR